MDDTQLEHRLLELAYTTDTVLTPAALAFYAPCTIEQAETLLDRLAATNRLRIESNDDGEIFYVMPNRQRIERPRPAAPPTPAPALVPIVPATHVIVHHQGERVSPGLAGLLSFLWPGAGQLYTGRIAAGIGWFFAVAIGYAFLIVPGLILHVLCAFSAARTAHEVNASRVRAYLQAGG